MSNSNVYTESKSNDLEQHTTRSISAHSSPSKGMRLPSEGFGFNTSKDFKQIGISKHSEDDCFILNSRCKSRPTNSVSLTSLTHGREGIIKTHLEVIPNSSVDLICVSEGIAQYCNVLKAPNASEHVILAAASSSVNMGKISCFPSVKNPTEKNISNKSTLELQSTISDMPENFVSSTSGYRLNSTFENLDMIKFRQWPDDATTPVTTHAISNEALHNQDNLNFVDMKIKLYGVGCSDSLSNESNGNPEQVHCYFPDNNSETADGADEEENREHSIKDETDSAEDENNSEDEATDSASESELVMDKDLQRCQKPVITISDQFFPRLVIDFGEDCKTEVIRILKNESTRRDKCLDSNGTYGGTSSECEPKSGTVEPNAYDEAIESAQRSKRKRTESERQD